MEGQRKENARREYRQLVLSGFEGVTKHRDKDGNSSERADPGEEIKDITGKGSYLVFIPVVIKQVGAGDYQYDIQVSFNDDVDIPVSAYSQSRKKAIEPTVTIPRPKGEKRTTLHMVYGVHTSGGYSLSHSPGGSLPEGIASVYSEVLVSIDRALQRALLKPEKQKRNDDARKRLKSSSTPKSLGTDKKRGRGKEIHPEILPETLPEKSSRMDELNGEILGGGQGNGEHTLRELGSIPDNRETA